VPLKFFFGGGAPYIFLSMGDPKYIYNKIFNNACFQISLKQFLLNNIPEFHKQKFQSCDLKKKNNNNLG